MRRVCGRVPSLHIVRAHVNASVISQRTLGARGARVASGARGAGPSSLIALGASGARARSRPPKDVHKSPAQAGPPNPPLLYPRGRRHRPQRSLTHRKRHRPQHRLQRRPQHLSPRLRDPKHRKRHRLQRRTQSRPQSRSQSRSQHRRHYGIIARAPTPRFCNAPAKTKAKRRRTVLLSRSRRTSAGILTRRAT